MTEETAPDAACVLALANLPGIGPRTLHRLISELGPGQAWAAVLAGDEVRPPARSGPAGEPWAEAARRDDPPARLAAASAARIGVTWPGAPSWPAVLAADPRPPGALFWRGDLGSLAWPTVAVVGTRHATAEGRSVAYELGRDLTAAGIAVVSGLALGIDGAAHAGALDPTGARPGPARVSGGGEPTLPAPTGPPIGVSASGVDQPYPKRHVELWSRVAAAGVVLSEAPPGARAVTWRFPSRNHIIAALARLVVVVESRDRGGSMLTVEAALARDVDVAVVPGPVHSAASAGTNQLLMEGARPVRHAGDVLDTLGLVQVWDPKPASRPAPLTKELRLVLEAVDWRPTRLNLIVERTGLPLGVIGGHLEALGERGLVTEEAGRWARSGRWRARSARPGLRPRPTRRAPGPPSCVPARAARQVASPPERRADTAPGPLEVSGRPGHRSLTDDGVVTTIPSDALALHTLVTPEGHVELSLQEVPVPEPGPHQLLVRVEAAPINPSDMGLLFAGADPASFTRGGAANRPTATAALAPGGLRAMEARLGQSMPAGNEGAGTVVAAGPDQEAMVGRVVAAAGGGMYSQYRLVDAALCVPLPEGVTAAEGAASFVNPMTALGMVETMRSEGHSAIVHTAAASNLGQMLQRLCLEEGISLVNVVRSPAQATMLRDLGAEHVCDSSTEGFMADLIAAVAATGATIGFDAIGGGSMASRILAAMETVASSGAAYSRYGSDTFKQVYIYGSLDRAPTELTRSFGFSWSLSGWLLTPFLVKAGAEKVAAMRDRVAAGITTTFATRFTDRVSLVGALAPAAIADYGRQATGQKYLLEPGA